MNHSSLRALNGISEQTVFILSDHLSHGFIVLWS